MPGGAEDEKSITCTQGWQPANPVHFPLFFDIPILQSCRPVFFSIGYPSIEVYPIKRLKGVNHSRCTSRLVGCTKDFNAAGDLITFWMSGVLGVSWLDISFSSLLTPQLPASISEVA